MNSRQRRKANRRFKRQVEAYVETFDPGALWLEQVIILDNALTSQDLEAGFNRLKADHGK